MDSLKQSFKIGSVSCLIEYNVSTITIQIQKKKLFEAKQSYTLDQLKKESIYFYLFSSLDEAFNQIILLGKDNKIIIKEQNDHYQAKILVNHKELSKVRLSIQKIMVIPSELMEQESMKAIKALFDTQASMIQQLASHLESIEATLFKMNNLSIGKAQDSATITLSDDIITGKTVGFLNEDEKAMLSEWLNHPTEWKLIFYPTKGRDNYQVCNDLCYGLPSVVVLIETSSGVRFGAYTSVGWDKQPHDGSCKQHSLYDNIDKYKADAGAFLFSINKKKKYPVQPNHIHNAICTWQGYSLCFDYEFYMFDNFLSRGDSVINLNNYGNASLNEINNGNGSFQAHRVFVYQIIY